MRFDRLDLNLLVVLDALLDLRSVSAAARQLHVSQPAVTASLNRLRDYFDDELLKQSGRAMLVTAKGQALVDPVRRALMQIRTEITRPGTFDAATTSRRFRIAASDYAYTVLLAGALADAAIEAPLVTFDVVPPGVIAVEQMERAELDVFLTVAQMRFPQWRHRALFCDEEVAISWTGAGYGELTADLFFSAGHAVALLGPDRQPTLADRHLGEASRERRVDVLVGGFGALPLAVVGTTRLATLHRLYAEHFAQLYPIAIHPMPVPVPNIVEIAQWHPAREQDGGVRWLLRMLQGQVARLPASTALPD